MMQLGHVSAKPGFQNAKGAETLLSFCRRSRWNKKQTKATVPAQCHKFEEHITRPWRLVNLLNNQHVYVYKILGDISSSVPSSSCFAGTCPPVPAKSPPMGRYSLAPLDGDRAWRPGNTSFPYMLPCWIRLKVRSGKVCHAPQRV